LFALVTIGAATLFTAQPARAADDVELIILSMADGNGVVYDAMASCVGTYKGLIIDFEGSKESDIAAPGAPGGFGSDPNAFPEPLDSECCGYDLSAGQWYGRFARFIVRVSDGPLRSFRTMVYRMGAKPSDEILEYYLDTVARAHFREVVGGDGSTLANGCLVRTTNPAAADKTLCVIEARCKTERDGD
jgi:hypothetical protein